MLAPSGSPIWEPCADPYDSYFDAKLLSNMIPEVLHVGPVGSHAGSHIGAIFGKQNSMEMDSQTDPFG